MELPPLNEIDRYNPLVTHEMANEALRARLRLAMEYATHHRQCELDEGSIEGDEPVCTCGYTALRERLVAESLI